MPRGNFTPALDCTGQKRPHIPLQPIVSNKLHEQGYCPERQELAITFKPGGNVYHYPHFTQDKYAEFMAAESKGRYFGEHIQVLPSHKYDPEPVAAPTPAERQAPEFLTEDPDHGEDEPQAA